MPPVLNRTEHESVESNIVYPNCHTDKPEWKMIAKLDKEFVLSTLHRVFGSKVNRINNKYVVNVNGQYWYQHDNSTWLLQPLQSFDK